MKAISIVGIFSLLAAPASAAPSVFVKSEPNSMWWDGAMTARILGTSAGPVTAEKLSAYLEKTMIYYSYRVCSLEAVQGDTFVGIDRATQLQIDEYRPHVSWRAESVAPGGRRILGQSVVFEGCEADDPRGGALLVTDIATGEILRWVPMGSYTNKSGDAVPIWVMFLDPRHEGGEDLFSTSLCRDCGDRTHVYYDVTRRHIYTEHNGH
ncbi:hypothetical protein [Sphingopyxis sp. 22461]|uniref:hypothetical protein n=1 Tax=Sphingopyxis sp. 22461 TaxID=3453923 RepID=UPI003F82B9AB